jgi:succinoglycan biosynthesis protein ExoM
MHVSVCVCTYRRTDLLRRLLTELARQETQGLFTYSVVVVDNDAQESAKPIALASAESYPVPLVYCVETEQNIARARNRAVASASGDFVAFIDDDEFPITTWLLMLVRTCLERGVDGVLGPVQPHFEAQPPRWITRGKFYERATYPTGFVIDGAKGRTGNVLLRRSVFRSGQLPFRPEFVTGEDQDFFRRKIAEGHVFIWCGEAIAYEIVPPSRWKRAYVLRKALMRGKYSVLEPVFGIRDLGKSLLAVPVYTIALPVLCVMGQHHLMRCLQKLCHHVGKILACMKFDPIGDRYVSE